MSMRSLALVVLVPFAAFSTWVIAQHGYTGFLGLAAREPWALQMLLDLTISLVGVSAWMVLDARRRGRTVWPFLIGTAFLGSIAPLCYLVMRGRDRT